MKTLRSVTADLLSPTSIPAWRVSLPLLFLGAGLMLVQPCAGGVFIYTGSLNTARYSHTAIPLLNGMVLVAGGNDGNPLASAELYDPASGTWTATGSLAVARDNHTATPLPNGMVLVAGGAHYATMIQSATLYDPASGTWSATGGLNTTRVGPTATLLSNGMVLIAGGINFNSGVLASAELWDPATGTWTVTGSLALARVGHTATLLPNGKVLLAGGSDASGLSFASAELYDPVSETWSATGSLNTARYSHTATLLPNGMVLVAGGVNDSILGSAELYDPASGSWTVTGSLNTARSRHTATLLPSGMVLVAGGDSIPAGNSAELYDSSSGTWSATGSLNTARDLGTATLLPNGKVLVAGGSDVSSGVPLASAELYDPAAPPPTGKALNISTRVDVETGDNVAIGGFIINGGTTSKTVIIRAIGPSLANTSPPVAGPLADPVLELHKPDGSIVTNNNWKDNTATDQAIITANGLDQFNGKPINNLESVLVATLAPKDPAVNGSGEYTAIMSGSGGGTGIGLVEVYDLDDPSAIAELANISTRGLVGTDDKVLIGGVIMGPIGGNPPVSATVVVRAIGPSLANAVPPVAGFLADPVIELYNADGSVIATNDNWQQNDPTTVAEIQADGLAPTNASESVILATLVAGDYTAIVTGVNATTGVGLVEVFHVPTPTTLGPTH